MRVKMLMRRRLETPSEGTRILLEGTVADLPDDIAADWVRRGVAEKEPVIEAPASPPAKPKPAEAPVKPKPPFTRLRKDPDENKSEGESESED